MVDYSDVRLINLNFMVNIINSQVKMKIFSWNIREDGRGGIKAQLKNLLIEYNPDIIILMETNVNSN